MRDPAQAGLLTADRLIKESDATHAIPGQWLRAADTTALGQAACRLRILGDFSLVIQQREIDVGPGVVELLALLAIVGRLSRERVQATLWPSAEPMLTAGRLRSLVYRLRQVSGEYVITSGPSAIIELNPDVAVDYQIASAIASRALHQDTTSVIALARVTSLLATELLPLHTWEWLPGYQHAWTRTRLRALEACAGEALKVGDRETAIVACESVILLEPFHERVHYMMVIALLQEGYEQMALSVYDRLRVLLADELRCVPARTYRELRDAALR
jgi:SARP family transcriptional regulator, regulator of embCAB operon